MEDPEKNFIRIGEQLQEENDVEFGQMFGKRCFKFKGKAFAAFFQNCMVFKLLNEKSFKEAMDLPGSKLWDPSGKKRPMKQWVQVNPEHFSQWSILANAALSDQKK